MRRIGCARAAVAPVTLPYRTGGLTETEGLQLIHHITCGGGIALGRYSSEHIKMGTPNSKVEETINLQIVSKFETDNREANIVSHTFLKWVGAVITIVFLLVLSCYLAYKY